MRRKFPIGKPKCWDLTHIRKELIMKYWVEVELIMSDEVEADSPEQAFEILSDAAISGGDWLWSCTPIEDED